MTLAGKAYFDAVSKIGESAIVSPVSRELGEFHASPGYISLQWVKSQAGLPDICARLSLLWGYRLEMIMIPNFHYCWNVLEEAIVCIILGSYFYLELYWNSLEWFTILKIAYFSYNHPLCSTCSDPLVWNGSFKLLPPAGRPKYDWNTQDREKVSGTLRKVTRQSE